MSNVKISKKQCIILGLQVSNNNSGGHFMLKNHARHKQARPQDFDIYDDIGRIKEALADCTRDIKGKAAHIWLNHLMVLL